MWAIFEKFGLGSIFGQCVRLLYTTPRASIRVNGLQSSNFRLCRGTRQGCPLSPLLFSIAIEPLACLIRASSDVTGMIRGAMEENISLYADDDLLFLTNIRSSLPAAMKYIEEFGRFSGLGINWEKSMLLPLDPIPDSIPPTVSHLRVVSFIKYLGIIISASPQSYIRDNILPLFSRLQAQSKTWNKLPVSIVGRINLNKIIWMPQLLYFLHNAPICLPLQIFNTLEK